MRILAVLAALLTVVATSAVAQKAVPPKPAAVAPAAPVEPPPPYEPQLMRMAEILGALAYLRDLCGDRDGEQWRAKMAAVIEAEAKTDARRDRLAGAFNRGFRGYEVTYRACTDNARTVMTRYLDEAGKLARDISGRYGNS